MQPTREDPIHTVRLAGTRLAVIHIPKLAAFNVSGGETYTEGHPCLPERISKAVAYWQVNLEETHRMTQI